MAISTSELKLSIVLRDAELSRLRAIIRDLLASAALHPDDRDGAAQAAVAAAENAVAEPAS